MADFAQTVVRAAGGRRGGLRIDRVLEVPPFVAGAGLALRGDDPAGVVAAMPDRRDPCSSFVGNHLDLLAGGVKAGVRAPFGGRLGPRLRDQQTLRGALQITDAVQDAVAPLFDPIARAGQVARHQPRRAGGDDLLDQGAAAEHETGVEPILARSEPDEVAHLAGGGQLIGRPEPHRSIGVGRLHAHGAGLIRIGGAVHQLAAGVGVGVGKSRVGVIDALIDQFAADVVVFGQQAAAGAAPRRPTPDFPAVFQQHAIGQRGLSLLDGGGVDQDEPVVACLRRQDALERDADLIRAVVHGVLYADGAVAVGALGAGATHRGGRERRRQGRRRQRRWPADRSHARSSSRAAA